MTAHPPETQLFDRLTAWAALGDAALQACFSVENANLLREMISLLGDESERSLTVDESTFVTGVRKMRIRCKEGSRSLGIAIIAGSDLRDGGKIEEAKQVFERFLSTCPSEFYQNIARHCMVELDRPITGGRRRVTW